MKVSQADRAHLDWVRGSGLWWGIWTLGGPLSSLDQTLQVLSASFPWTPKGLVHLDALEALKLGLGSAWHLGEGSHVPRSGDGWRALGKGLRPGSGAAASLGLTKPLNMFPLETRDSCFGPRPFLIRSPDSRPISPLPLISSLLCFILPLPQPKLVLSPHQTCTSKAGEAWDSPLAQPSRDGWLCPCVGAGAQMH